MAREEGWQYPMGAKKAHYFVGGRSLCGGWISFADGGTKNQAMTDAPGPDDCKPCWKKAQKRAHQP